MPRRIEDYALIGDTQTAALVARDGSIDWLCLPRFDSDACFSALLGTEEHGLWRLAPEGGVTGMTRRYRPGTLVLETEFTTADGVVRIIDCMPPRQETPDLVRVVEGVRGRVPMSMLLRIRFGYGRIRPWIRRTHSYEFVAVAGPDALGLRTAAPVEQQGADLVSRFSISEGERVGFVLTWGPSNLSMPVPVNPFRALEDTEKWWHNWMRQCCYSGPWEEAVRQSLVTLKALTYLPTGGIVAAPTTSLPEAIGGVRNWDYRFCWLRDASFTLRALMVNGFEREASAWRDWLLRAAAGDASQLQIMYGCAGERRLPELEIPWLPGFEGSSPVRVGNGAVDQFQLDIYGELMDVLHEARRLGLAATEDAWRLQQSVLSWLESNASRTDRGIWEVRGPERHFTHSKVMAWVAFDRAVQAVERFKLEGPIDRWRKHRDALRDEILHHGYDAKLNAFTQSYGSKDVDAALLQIPLVGFLPATDPRVRGTVEAIERELRFDGLVRRYRTRQDLDGLPHSEGAFLACSFWLADNYQLLGRTEDARVLFERLLSIRNDVGLLAEEYDPDEKRQLGNFPQAFSHVALVNTARHLSRGEPPRTGNGGRGKAL